MQKIATKVFILASVAFFVIGMIMVFTTPEKTGPNPTMLRFLFGSVVVILTSFALSVAGKYLSKN